jgi:hypothetical protein
VGSSFSLENDDHAELPSDLDNQHVFKRRHLALDRVSSVSFEYDEALEEPFDLEEYEDFESDGEGVLSVPSHIMCQLPDSLRRSSFRLIMTGPQTRARMKSKSMIASSTSITLVHQKLDS